MLNKSTHLYLYADALSSSNSVSCNIWGQGQGLGRAIPPLLKLRTLPEYNHQKVILYAPGFQCRKTLSRYLRQCLLIACCLANIYPVCTSCVRLCIKICTTIIVIMINLHFSVVCSTCTLQCTRIAPNRSINPACACAI